MIKHWQSMHDYKYFLTESKVHFDSSERNRLHTELWKAWQKLHLFNTDKAMKFLLPFYSATDRPKSHAHFYSLYSPNRSGPTIIHLLSQPFLKTTLSYLFAIKFPRLLYYILCQTLCFPLNTPYAHMDNILQYIPWSHLESHYLLPEFLYLLLFSSNVLILSFKSFLLL